MSGLSKGFFFLLILIHFVQTVITKLKVNLTLGQYFTTLSPHNIPYLFKTLSPYSFTQCIYFSALLTFLQLAGSHLP